MGKFKDLTGQRFGRLTVAERAESTNRRRVKWLCKCDCGNEVIVSGDDLHSGNTKSCKCLRSENSRQIHKTHGLTNTRLHNIWSRMIDRCCNPQSKFYNSYGGRGISICVEWRNSFQAFYDWAKANGYAETLSIDRIDNDGNYCPENCRWATAKEQSNNRRSNTLVTMNGKTQTVTHWCNELGLKNRDIVYKRLNAGWPPEKAFFTASRKRGRA